MRIDYDAIQVKHLDDTKNPILEKRKKKAAAAK